jgi:hypothetical protein
MRKPWKLKYTGIIGATGMAKNAARVLKRKIINEYGLGKNGGQLLNKINSIAKKIGVNLVLLGKNETNCI